MVINSWTRLVQLLHSCESRLALVAPAIEELDPASSAIQAYGPSGINLIDCFFGTGRPLLTVLNTVSDGKILNDRELIHHNPRSGLSVRGTQIIDLMNPGANPVQNLTFDRHRGTISSVLDG